MVLFYTYVHKLQNERAQKLTCKLFLGSETFNDRRDKINIRHTGLGILLHFQQPTSFKIVWKYIIRILWNIIDVIVQ